ncbi:putative ABC transporter permease [Fulvivirga imtechensis AK7]|uniref:Putative ABC transporter permease n=1 Tax=Fulvivirga imtechensis AK7 TaxID=1237149 RepID=L8JHG4_9BACT|nr:ABC transporter permease [Fulvivirga imtechensis]ELR68276.1 putative ABC transporter permease [Fulvivirga imtechensis AK7]
MLKNYLKATIRNLVRNKIFSTINIFGLAIGLASALFIGLWINDEYSFDKQHKKGDRIYKVINEIEFNGKPEVTTNSPIPFAEVLSTEVPGIAQTIKMSKPHFSLFKYVDRKIEEAGIYADTNILEVFDFELVKGDRKTALNNKFSLLITEGLAERIFQGEDAMGKSITVDDWGYRNDYTVTGIIKDIPQQSSLQLEYIMPYETYLDHRPWYNKWSLYNEPLFVLLEEEAVEAEVEDAISKIIYQHYEGLKTTSYLYPYQELYLHSNFTKGIAAEGRIIYVRMFAVIGLLIILIACINFMNLSTAKAAQRAKEVGIRKTIGAHKNSLIIQFLGESVLLALVSGTIAVTTTQALLPFFNALTGKAIEMPLDNPYFMGIVCLTCVATGLLAGIYPALYLSAFSPSKVLKGIYKGGKAFGGFRKLLVVVQFTLSLIFIVGSIFIYKQFEYVMNKDLGANKDNIIFHHLNGIMGDPSAYKNDVMALPGVKNMTVSSSSPFSIVSSTIEVSWPGNPDNENITFDIIQADEDFVETFGLRFKTKLDAPLKSDSINVQFLLNEEAAKVMGLNDPVGAAITTFSAQGQVVGIVEDFHNKSFFEKISPVVIIITDHRIWGSYIALEDGGNLEETIAGIKAVYDKYEHSYPFDYSFVNEEFAEKYVAVRKVGELSGIFSAIAIVVSCLGLFGLSAFIAEQRKAELGIRKAFGASISQLIFTFLKQFLWLVAMAFTVSAPLCWYFVNNWLHQFEYKIDIAPVPFLIGGFLVLLIALCTVSFNTIRVAIANPADTLRQE